MVELVAPVILGLDGWFIHQWFYVVACPLILKKLLHMSIAIHKMKRFCHKNLWAYIQNYKSIYLIKGDKVHALICTKNLCYDHSTVNWTIYWRGALKQLMKESRFASTILVVLTLHICVCTYLYYDE